MSEIKHHLIRRLRLANARRIGVFYVLHDRNGTLYCTINAATLEAAEVWAAMHITEEFVKDPADTELTWERPTPLWRDVTVHTRDGDKHLRLEVTTSYGPGVLA